MVACLFFFLQLDLFFCYIWLNIDECILLVDENNLK